MTDIKSLFIIYLAVGILSFIILYYVIRSAVKNGIIGAKYHLDMNEKEETIKMHKEMPETKMTLKSTHL